MAHSTHILFEKGHVIDIFANRSLHGQSKENYINTVHYEERLKI